MAATALIRVEAETHERLLEIARAEHTTVGEVVAEAVRRYEDERFWKSYNESYERLAADPVAWREWEEEIAVFDGALADGLDDDPYAE